MSNQNDPKVETIVFGRKELDPVKEAEYARKIAEAKKRGPGLNINSLKGNDPVGGDKPPMPNFAQLQQQLGRGAAPISPEGGVQPRPPGSPLLSPETERQLTEALKASAKEEQVVAEESKAAETEKLEESVLNLFDFESNSNEADRVLNNKKRRKDIESRCQPMNFEDLLIKDEVQQVVPILPGKFEPTYRSITPEENLFIKRYMSKEEQGQTDAYIMEKFALCQLACSLVSINGRLLPDHRKSDGVPDEKLFEAKLKRLTKMSGYVVADLGINYAWFDIRVRKLISPDALGNG